MKKIHGVLSAIFSIYDENMDVKEESVEKLVNYHLDNGLAGFYVGGNTGECTVLPNKTRKQMLEAVVKFNEGRGVVIAHVGSGHLEDVLDLIDHANKLNIDAIASLPPSLTGYYNNEEIIEYYKMIAERSKHPVIAYVTPILQGDIVGFAKQISKIPNIAGLKISIPDYYMFGHITRMLEDTDLVVFNGPDETMICGLAEGADGAIGTTYNILPKLAASIYENFNKGNMKQALALQRRMNDFIDILIDSNIAWWKAPLSLIGFDMGYTVAPQKLPNEKDLQILKEKLEEINYKELI